MKILVVKSIIFISLNNISFINISYYFFKFFVINCRDFHPELENITDLRVNNDFCQNMNFKH